MRPIFLMLTVLTTQSQTPLPKAPPQSPPKIMVLPRARFTQDMLTKNLEDILTLYTPDAVFIDPSGQEADSPATMRKFYEHIFATYDSDLVWGKTSTDFETPHGNQKLLLVVQSGEYSENLGLRESGKTMHMCGDYKFSYIQQDSGQWLISRMEWTGSPCPSTT